ncbi:MAG: stage 0 sporulation protein, partial [Lachnospiraceae bacterium]|nr:stage 0 sporulation protein [Lachnospiraceae bacterium]
RQKVKLIVTLEDDSKEIEEYSVDDLRFKPKRRKNDNQVNDAELKALEALEAKEVGSKLDDD